jgi:hypothetical protein
VTEGHIGACVTASRQSMRTRAARFAWSCVHCPVAPFSKEHSHSEELSSKSRAAPTSTLILMPVETLNPPPTVFEAVMDDDGTWLPCRPQV